MKEIIEELMNEQKVEKQLKIDQQEIEMLNMTKSLYSERCKFDRLKNEHNSLKVNKFELLILWKFLFRSQESLIFL